MIVELPIPPSANHIWRAVTRQRKHSKAKTFVVKSRQYTDWLDEAVLLLRCGLGKVQAYPVAVRIVVHGGKGWDVRRDLDNVAKPIIDAIKLAERIADDSTNFVTDIALSFVLPANPKQKATCTVQLCEVWRE